MKRIANNIAGQIAGARVINYEGRWMVYVEETGFDAVEISMREDIAVPEGYFMEPVNSGVLGVFPV